MVDTIGNKITAIIATVINCEVDKLNENSRIESLFIDSLSFVRIIVEIEEYFNIEFLPEDLTVDKFKTINDIKKCVSRLMESEE